MAAGVAAAAGHSVLLCEKMEKPARKVRITGKGRCNLTNIRPEKEFLEKVKNSAEFFGFAFRAFTNDNLAAFFEAAGVPLTVERGGRVFPTSGKAWDIADAHIKWCTAQGAGIECNTKVTEIFASVGRVSGVLLNKKSGTPEKVSCRNVIIATGGMSYPATGSTGDGYALAHALGHRIEPVRPSLVPLESPSRFMQQLKGLALKNVSVRLVIDNETVQEEFGEMEFTGSGVGGPVVLKLSRRAVDALIEERAVGLSVDLKPALTEEKLIDRIDRETGALSAKSTLHNLMRTMMPASLVIPFIDGMGLPTDVKIASLGRSHKERIVGHLKNFSIEINDYRPFEEAVITAGGVATDEVYAETMRSKLVDGLYFAGEVLDIDADTGGYNLQVAYSTGHLAGKLL